MTYGEAAETLKSTYAWMDQMLGARLACFIIYQTGDQAITGQTTNWQDYFGALRHDLSPKGAYTQAVEAVLQS